MLVEDVVNCGICQKEILLDKQKRYTVKKTGRKHLFCSPECSKTWQRNTQKIAAPFLKDGAACTKCGSLLTLENSRVKNRGGGKYGTNTLCTKCFSNYISIKYLARKLALIKFLGGKCCRCNGEFHPASYHFHHLDPEKKEFEWKKLRLKSLVDILKELSNAILICANCHCKEHASEGNWQNQDQLPRLTAKYLDELKELSTGEKTTRPLPNNCQQCQTPTANKRYCSYRCAQLSKRRVERPDAETLKQNLTTMDKSAVGRLYGVSDAAIRKWAKAYELNW